MSKKLVFFALASVLVASFSVQAEVRPEVVERIKPVATIAIAKAAQPATPAAEAPKAAEPAPAPAEQAKAEPAPAPAAAPATEAAPATAAVNGEAVFNKVCLACHLTGAAGAPKVGDKAAWEKRLPKGIDGLLQSAINGVPGTAMAPRGTCAACSDEELKAAVEFMVSKVQ